MERINCPYRPNILSKYSQDINVLYIKYTFRYKKFLWTPTSVTMLQGSYRKFGFFWSVSNLILESAAVKGSSLYHAFSPRVPTWWEPNYTRKSRVPFVVLLPRIGKLWLGNSPDSKKQGDQQKNRGPDVFSWHEKTGSNNTSSSFEKVPILDPQNNFSSC